MNLKAGCRDEMVFTIGRMYNYTRCSVSGCCCWGCVEIMHTRMQLLHAHGCIVQLRFVPALTYGRAESNYVHAVLFS